MAEGIGSSYRGNKTMVFGAVQRGGRVHFRAMPTPRATQKMTRDFVKDVVIDDAEFIYTDESNAYPDFTGWHTKHRGATTPKRNGQRASPHEHRREPVEPVRPVRDWRVSQAVRKASARLPRRSGVSLETARTLTCSAIRSRCSPRATRCPIKRSSLSPPLRLTRCAS
jgi:hypothetical protein